jgi:hypothetical protein
MKTLQKLITAVSIAITAVSYAQETGTIKGTVKDEKGETIPSANVAIMEDSILVMATSTDINGDYTFKQLSPGAYDLQFSFTGYQTRRIKNVGVLANQTSYANKTITPQAVALVNVIVTAEKWEAPIIKGNIATITNITIDQIENIAASPGDIVGILTAVTPGVLATNDGKDIYMRGSRRGSTAYYIDGNKIMGDAEAPGLGISGMQVLTGGMPAEYGDCTGGVVIIETKEYRSEMRRKQIDYDVRKEREANKNMIKEENGD